MPRKRAPNTKAGRIWFDAYPPEHAQRACDAGYYVEALQVLHLWLEVKLQEWVLLSRHKNIRGSYKTVWDSAFSIPFFQAVRMLFVTGKMPKQTYDAANRFNAMRNKVIHRLFHAPYEGGAPSVGIAEYQAAFKIGMKLSDKLEGHLARLATRGKPGRG